MFDPKKRLGRGAHLGADCQDWWLDLSRLAPNLDKCKASACFPLVIYVWQLVKVGFAQNLVSHCFYYINRWSLLAGVCPPYRGGGGSDNRLPDALDAARLAWCRLGGVA